MFTATRARGQGYNSEPKGRSVVVQEAAVIVELVTIRELELFTVTRGQQK